MSENRILMQGTDFVSTLVQAKMVGMCMFTLLQVQDVFSNLVIGHFKTPLSVMFSILNILQALSVSQGCVRQGVASWKWDSDCCQRRTSTVEHTGVSSTLQAAQLIMVLQQWNSALQTGVEAGKVNIIIICLYMFLQLL